MRPGRAATADLEVSPGQRQPHLVAVRAVVSPVLPGRTGAGFRERYTAAGYIKNLLVGYPYHFIPLLLLMYAASPLLVSVGKKHGRLLITAIGAYQLLLLSLVRADVTALKPLEVLVPLVVGRTMADWAVYFPLGLVYALNMRATLPRLEKVKWLLTGATVVLFALGALHWTHVIRLPLASYLSPVPLVLILPVLDRQSIPFVDALENIGKRSYGLYLTHLITLDLVLVAIAGFGRGLFRYPAALLPALFAVALLLPLFVMNSLARSRARVLYRYVMG